MNKLSLDSDFRDYWDFACDAPGPGVPVLTRRAAAQVPRGVYLTTLGRFGYPVPQHGLVRRLKPTKQKGIVIYEDPFAHRGEGKILVPRNTASAAFRDRYAAVYMGDYPPQGHPVSYRTLVVGRRQFLLVYTSDDVWRSNVGSSVDVEVLEETTDHAGQHRRLPFPLYAVDFVRYQGQPWYVDLNTAPGLKGTGMEARMTPTQVYEQLRDWRPA